MHSRVDPYSTVKTTFSVITLAKATRTADSAINWQIDVISLRKHTFSSVVNFKGGIAYWAPGFTRLCMYTLVQAEWAGQVVMALRRFFFADWMHPCLSCGVIPRKRQKFVLC